MKGLTKDLITKTLIERVKVRLTFSTAKDLTHYRIISVLFYSVIRPYPSIMSETPCNQSTSETPLRELSVVSQPSARPGAAHTFIEEWIGNHKNGKKELYVYPPVSAPDNLRTEFKNIWMLQREGRPPLCKKDGSKLEINRDAKVTSEHWLSYRQCCDKIDGTPYVICIICKSLQAHPAQHGSSALGKHLKSTGCQRSARRLRTAQGETTAACETSIATLLARQGLVGQGVS